MAAASALLLDGAPADDAAVTDHLLEPLQRRTRLGTLLLGVSGAATLLFVGLIAYTVTTGIGLWGNNIPVAWGFAITNFVWWIGIGHAGTFISAFLLLLEQPWRRSLNRIAEAMTLFAVANAALFPLLHLGRPWFFYYLVPYPATMGVWPQFRSALPWDVAAIATYGTVSLLFWYVGLLPDLAVARDRLRGRRRRRVYGLFALGWNGSARTWRRHRIAYGLIAALAAPLVVSVHSIVSMDFAITSLPGWHSTIFPPYFVIGALYSGFAMVVTLVVPVRVGCRLEDVITARHLDAMARILLVLGWLLILCYAGEIFCAWLVGDPFDRYLHFHARPFGPYAPAFWTVVACNCLVPQLLWWPAVRARAGLLLALSLLIQVGMWTERFVIVVGSLNRDFLPASWGLFVPTWVDAGLLAGSVGFFVFLFLLFLRFVPPVPISEVKHLRHELAERGRP
jgi:molybdopterin-containing oxidoreductase family membrane subunit